jgi:cytochrome c
MARSITAADFIRANMPFGTDFEHPVLAVRMRSTSLSL